MKIEKKTQIKEDGTSITTGTITTSPEDGFVEGVSSKIDDFSNIRWKHKGYANKAYAETDDPRVVKIGIVFLTSFIILIVAMVCFFGDESFMIPGILVIVFAIVAMIGGLRQNKKREKKFLENPSYDPKDKQPIVDFTKEVVGGFKESKKHSKFNRKRFFLIATPIYIITTLVISFLADYFIEIPAMAGYSVFGLMFGYFIFFGLFAVLIILIGF